LSELLVLAVLLENKYLETASKTGSENRVYSMDARALVEVCTTTVLVASSP
jgi:hypothetical protein